MRTKRVQRLILGLAIGLLLAVPAAAGELQGVEIVAWTGYVGELEWANLRNMLEGAGATILETDTRDPGELSALLEGADVLLLPEQADGWLADLASVGRQLAPALNAFLSEGKRIVALTWAWGGEDILRGAGLTTAEDWRDVTGERLTVVAPPDDLLVAGMPREFTAPELTTDFADVDDDAVTLVATQDGAPVMFRMYREGGEIVLLGFDFLDRDAFNEQLAINACRPEIPPAFLVLVTGEELEGTLGPGARWESAREQYALAVHPESHYVLVELEGDLDLHLRRNEAVEFVGDRAVADLALLGPGGHLVLLSVDMLSTDRVIFALQNPSGDPQDYRLIAWIIPGLEAIDTFPFDTTGELGPMPVAALDRFVETQEGYLALVQYRIAVADGHEHLSLSVIGQDIRAYIRHGEPVTLAGGAVEADLRFTDSVTLSGPFLVPGVYYIAIEGLTPPQEYDIEGDLR